MSPPLESVVQERQYDQVDREKVVMIVYLIYF